MSTIYKEYFPIIDESGTVVGKASRLECHSGSMLLHPVVHLQLFNNNHELYLQKRSLTKDIQPGKWDTAVGGHVDYGEQIEEALMRETREEIGITDFEPTISFKYIYESTIEREMVHSYYTIYDGEIYPNADELEEGRFWSIDEIKASLGKEVFTPNFEHEFNLLISSEHIHK